LLHGAAQVALRPQVALEGELALLDAARGHVGEEVPGIHALDHRPGRRGLLHLIFVRLRIRVAASRLSGSHRPRVDSLTIGPLRIAEPSRHMSWIGVAALGRVVRFDKLIVHLLLHQLGRLGRLRDLGRSRLRARSLVLPFGDHLLRVGVAVRFRLIGLRRGVGGAQLGFLLLVGELGDRRRLNPPIAVVGREHQIVEPRFECDGLGAGRLHIGGRLPGAFEVLLELPVIDAVE
jgi:hypothetical protein